MSILSSSRSRGFLTFVVLCIVGGTALFPVFHHRLPVKPAPAPTISAPQKPIVATPKPTVPPVDPQRIQQHIQMLAGTIGVRRAGTPTERQAADYVASQLASWGYTVHRVKVPLPNGLQSEDIYAELPGKSPRLLLIGGHMDSKAPAPGANDDASGVAVMLELARVLRQTTPPYSCRFVAFGAEEMIDRHRDHHHFGSRLLAADPVLRKQLQSMTSLDMVGIGTVLHVDNQGWAGDTWRNHLAQMAKGAELPTKCGRSKPWSDHEAFEKNGIPTAYLHWERDSAYHTAADRPARIQPARLVQTAQVMVRGILSSDMTAGQ